MKFYYRYWFFVMTGVFWMHLMSASVSASSAISDMILIPNEEPVRVKLPETSQYFEIHSPRAIPPGTEIVSTPSSTCQIICPDFSLREISSGKPVCPEKASEVDLMVEVPPDWGVVPPESGKGNELDVVSLTDTELQRLNSAEEAIHALTVDENVKTFLLVHLYVGQRLYPQAIDRFEAELTSQQVPAALRLLGYLYLQAGEFRKSGIAYSKALTLSQDIGDVEGQAVAHHQLALLYQLFDRLEQAAQHAQAALEYYQRLGYTEPIENLQELF